MTQNTSLADTVQRLRREAGLTLRQLEANSGVDRSAISRIERGEYLKPTPRTLTRLAEALRTDASELLTAAGYTADRADGLPALPMYLRTKYGHLPAKARRELAEYVGQLEAEYGAAKTSKGRSATKTSKTTRGGR